MLKKFLVTTTILLTFVLPSLAFGQTAASKGEQTVITQLQEQIKVLQIQITALTKQIEGQNKEIEKIKTEVAFTRTLQRGMTGDEVKKLQTFLKQFSDIYPEGLVTGYYGPLTESAVRKLQEKQGLPAVGFVGPKTLEKLNELVTEGAGSSGTIPPGLLTAPGIAKKIEIFATTTTTIPATVPQATSTSFTPVITATTTTGATATSTTLSTPVSSSGSGTSGTVVTITTPTATTTGTGTSSTATTTTSASPSTTVPITVTSPNGGSTWDVYSYNQGIYYTLNGVSRVGFKLLKGSQVVYSNSAPITTNSTSLNLPLATYSASVGSGSDYKIRVFDWDNPGTYDDSDDYFSIPTADITSPIVSSVSASGVTSNSAVITWTTDEPTDGFVNYGSTPNNWIVTPTNTSYTTSHSFTLSNLASNTLYTYRIYSRDAAGNGLQGTSPDYTFTTLSGPVSCSAINLTLNDGKTTYIKGVDNFVNYTWTCSPGGSANVNIGIQPPVGGYTSLNTTTNSATQTLSIDISGTNYPVGTYFLNACFNTCGSTVAEKTFSISSSPTSFLDLRKSNLSTVYYTLDSLKVILEKLSKLLQ